MLYTREKIIGNYYLVELEGGGYAIAYKTDDVYIGRSPSNSTVESYAIKDSLLVMRVRSYDGTSTYLSLNMNRDSEIAKEKEIFIDTISVKDFPDSRLSKIDLKFKKVK